MSNNMPRNVMVDAGPFDAGPFNASGTPSVWQTAIIMSRFVVHSSQPGLIIYSRASAKL